MADHQDDLAASKTEGFKVGEKKTIEEYTQLGMFLFVLLSTIISRWPMAPNGSDHPTPLPYASVTPVDTCRYNLKTNNIEPS